MEVHEQTDLNARQAQIADELRGVDSRQMLHRFDFHDELTFDDEIHAVAALEGHALVSNRQDSLALEA